MSSEWIKLGEAAQSIGIARCSFQRARFQIATIIPFLQLVQSIECQTQAGQARIEQRSLEQLKKLRNTQWNIEQLFSISLIANKQSWEKLRRLNLLRQIEQDWTRPEQVVEQSELFPKHGFWMLFYEMFSSFVWALMTKLIHYLLIRFQLKNKLINKQWSIKQISGRHSYWDHLEKY